jgi:general nucleoside transport system ATP-binding protein
MPFRVPLDVPVSALAAGEKQKLEILKQLYLKNRFLILDEPTSVLTPGEADEVLGLLRRMTREGKLTVLTITHKFREVMAYADEVTVLRRGRFAGSGRVSDLSRADMAEMMIGAREIPQGAARLNRVQFGNRSSAPIKGTVWQTHSLASGGQDHGFQTGRGLVPVRD